MYISQILILILDHIYLLKKVTSSKKININYVGFSATMIFIKIKKKLKNFTVNQVQLFWLILMGCTKESHLKKIQNIVKHPFWFWKNFVFKKRYNIKFKLKLIYNII